MKLNPKSYIVALAFFATEALPIGSQAAPVEALQTWAVFETGQDVFVRLRYAGGLKGWDAAFGYDGGRLTTVNSAFITVTDGEGKKLTSRPDKLHTKFINSLAKRPFDTRIDLAGVYDMSTPGRYTVEWGCEKVASRVIGIEIVKELPGKKRE